MISFGLSVVGGWSLAKFQKKPDISRRWESAGRIEFKEQLIQEIGRSIFIEEESRKKFITELAQTLERLINGELKGRNDFRRTLLGRKGFGKTCILNAICDACLKLNLTAYGLLVVNLNDQNSDRITPIEAILNKLPSGLRSLLENEIELSDMRVTTVATFLEKHGYYVLGLFDEFPNVFKNASQEHARNVALELSAIGDNTNGVFHWILSGSATYLRKIITAKLEAPKAGELPLFPYYTGIDLNGTKFRFHSIFPFLNKEDFINYLDFIKANNRDYYTLYLSSGGVPRLLSDFANEDCCDFPSLDYSLKSKGSFVTNDVKKAKDPTTTLLRSIARALDVSDPVSFNDEFEVVVKWTALVSVDTVISAFWQEYKGEAVNITGLCYELADKGLIRYLDKGNPEMIGFMSPYLFLEIFSSSVRITMDEAIALKTGNLLSRGTNRDLAGDVTLRLIALSAIKNPTAFEIPIDFNFDSMNIYDLNVSDLKDRCFNTMYKEKIGTGGSGKGQDAAGADGIVVHIDENQKKITLYRIQVKIYSELTRTQAEDICKRFKNMKNEVEAKFRELYSDYVIEQKLILATTANIIPGAETDLFFQQNSIMVWGKRFLAENVWTADIKLLGKKFQ